MKKPGKRELPNTNRAKFLGAYAECGNITRAAQLAKIHRSDHYAWMQDEEYANAFAEANKEACEALEMEARRRAVEGVQKPVIYQGQLCREPKRDKHGELVRDKDGAVIFGPPLTVREYSDTLLIFLMKGANPEKYRDNAKVEHTGPGGKPLEVTIKFVKPE